MTGNALEVQRRLAVLADRPTSVPAVEVRSLRRERAVARVLEELERPYNPAGRWIAGATAVGLAAGVSLLMASLSETEISAEGQGALLAYSRFEGPSACLSDAAAAEWMPCASQGLGNGARLQTRSQARAELVTQAGARLELGANAQLELSDLSSRSTRLRLKHGRLAVRVPPLGPKAEFTVIAPNATVVVHGTAFVVEAAAGQTRCCVSVSEGTVAIQSAGKERRIHAHQSWGCEGPSEVETIPILPEPHPVGPDDSRARAREAPRARFHSTGSTLALETRLLQDALGAERDGQPARAERSLVFLLRRYPKSVVVPDAKAALRRIRARSRQR
jgi:hypothetical protein